ncbi:MAG: hypothetical protein H6Q33_5418, partial [Deltaproteobacteria bacterium]|nr:hypothetical protein [Deltaproteobacteria bacterium]
NPGLPPVRGADERPHLVQIVGTEARDPGRWRERVEGISKHHPDFMAHGLSAQDILSSKRGKLQRRAV